MTRKPPQDEGPAKRPETPSGPPILRRIERAYRWLLFLGTTLLAKLWRFLVRNTALIASWTWEHRWNFWSGFFRIVTLLSVGYLVYDRIYETGATISSTGSDPKAPLYFPFAITNNSHIFTLRHLRWGCFFVRIEAPNIPIFNNVGVSTGGEVDQILPGDVHNVSCKRAIGGLPSPTKLSMYLEVQYETSILGYKLIRAPRMLFTWAADATNPQWIRGELAP